MRCPVCKADNPQGPQCRRCKADLSLLFALEEQRQRMLTGTQRCLRCGEWQAAAKRVEAADWLRRDEDTRQLLAMVYLVRRDFAAAWRCYQARETSSTS